MSVAPFSFGPIESIAARLHRARLRIAANPVQRRAARWRLGSWFVVVCAAWSVNHQLQTAEELRHDWGRTRAVVVVTQAVDVGEAVPAGALGVERFPVRTVPDGALTRPPTGGRAAVSLSVDQVLTDAMVDRGDRGAVASALPDGMVGVVVSTGTLQPPVETGDHVDVVATALEGPTFDGSSLDHGAVDSAAPVSRRAVVMRIDGDRVTLGVRNDQAVATAAAALVGPVALVLQP